MHSFVVWVHSDEYRELIDWAKAQHIQVFAPVMTYRRVKHLEQDYLELRNITDEQIVLTKMTFPELDWEPFA